MTNGQKVLLLTDELPQMLSDQVDSKDETVKQLTMAISRELHVLRKADALSGCYAGPLSGTE